MNERARTLERVRPLQNKDINRKSVVREYEVVGNPRNISRVRRIFASSHARVTVVEEIIPSTKDCDDFCDVDALCSYQHGPTGLYIAIHTLISYLIDVNRCDCAREIDV